MEVIRYTKEMSLPASAVTLGKFDGVHMGHRRLITEVNACREEGLKTVAFTFSMHPCRLFSNREIQLIYTEEEKTTLFSETGVDALVYFPFDDVTAQMAPEQFILEILVKRLHAAKIIVGPDFCFGNKRSGNIKTLEKYSKKCGYELSIVDKVMFEGENVSSSRIRRALAEGRMEKVNQMLGQPYFIEGEVVHGRQLGRKIDMPTANQLPGKEKLLPPKGVYASVTEFHGKSYASITNLGVKPTVGAENQMGAETFLFDFSGDLYGKNLRTSLLSYLRPERKFESLEALREQMKIDVEAAKEKGYSLG